jgi:hypothetical protein
LNGVLLPLAAALAVFLAVFLGMSGYYKMRYPHFPQPSQNRHRGRFRKNIEVVDDRATSRAAPFAYGKNLISRNLIKRKALFPDFVRGHVGLPCFPAGVIQRAGHPRTLDKIFALGAFRPPELQFKVCGLCSLQEIGLWGGCCCGV